MQLCAGPAAPHTHRTRTNPLYGATDSARVLFLGGPQIEKKKVNHLRIHSSGIGGDQHQRKLSTIEERIVAVPGAVAYAGISESGFPDPHTFYIRNNRSTTHLHPDNLCVPSATPTLEITEETQPIPPSRQPMYPSSPTPFTLEITEETQPSFHPDPMCPSSPTPTSQTIQNTTRPSIPTTPSVCFPRPIATTQSLSATRTAESENRSPCLIWILPNRQRAYLRVLAHGFESSRCETREGDTESGSATCKAFHKEFPSL
ncbi:hypothetical protein EVAR_98415_1 [Eumeta japonica]|uniref:Uncharacterized protein n=1 Tax=Eumeta variegata TaxID=151549 RepID=A0A4C2AH33_EUMVA|nr:hypothetical protein EVAR_98415_1 [Eumeta japonica]